jgi:pimeloyl-ACP methyl ester carboxylesterase
MLTPLNAWFVAVSAQTTTPQPAAMPAVQWGECQEEGFETSRCGTVAVPVEWSQPEGETIDLALVVRPADDPSTRIGALLLGNARGGSAIEQLRLALVSGVIAGALVASYDLVAVDPRGVGQSTPLECGRPQRTEGVTYTPQDQQAFDALVADNQALAEACAAGTGIPLIGLGLETSARDLDAVRAALGEEQITVYGIEHTTLVSRTYARMFPERVRGIILDTAVDDSLTVSQRLASEAAAVETGLERFAEWCGTSADCPLQGQDVYATFDAVVAQADQTPIPAGDHPPLTGYDVRRATQEHLVFRVAWPGFAAALTQAAAGDGTALTVSPDGTLVPLQEHVVGCVTTPAGATTLEELQGLERMVRQLAPHTGGATRAWDVLAGCIGWPDRPAERDNGAPVEGIPPALILESTHNTLAAYESGFSFAEQFPNSRILSRSGDDYSLVVWSRCIATEFDVYLTSGQLPAPGTICLD